MFDDPELSHDGEWLAWFGRVNNHRALVVKRVGDNQTEPFVASGEGWRLHRFDWLSDNRLLLSIGVPRAIQGVPVVVTRLVVVDPAKRNVRLMFKRDTQQGNFQIQDRVVSTLPDEPEFILVQMNPSPGRPEGVRYASVDSGRLLRRHAQKGQRDILQWQADRAGVVRVGYGVSSDQKSAILRLKDSAGKWQDYSSFVNEHSFSVVGLPVDQAGLAYVVSDHEFPLGALYEFDVDKGTFGTLLAQENASEISGISMGPDGTGIEVIYFSNELVPNRFVDPHYTALTASLDRQLTNTTNALVSASDDRQWMLVRAVASDVDPHYFLYNAAEKRADFLASEYRGLGQRMLAKTQLMSYEARDGLTIPAYITLPTGADSETASNDVDAPKSPFVVLPHGGPHARDFLRFDWLVQMIASQGFGVLQMNFRGSTGYGREFMLAGKGNWGKSMQDDITDGTHWLVEQGLADPNKLCIVGASYGGYAALMGAIREPELYQAAISLNGVADLPDLLRSQNRYQAGRYGTRFIGQLWKDRKSLAQNSPARRANEIRVPLLLVHGDKDRVVSVGHSRKMHRALRARKQGASDVTYIELADGDHHLSRGANRIAFAEHASDFLKTHCGDG
ncbi:MAG: prolyl oligopeptidase family serine peptidase [Pseudomonadaceae bacterium]|nr:prolyl oligopeptidase family serine peptidase [Pseudomonadaceae bacterium]